MLDKELFVNNSLKENTPVLFSKKISKKIKNKPYNNIQETIWERRHFVPASQEWYNSIYAYNKNYIKTIPVADINLMKLLKGYYNKKISFLKRKANLNYIWKWKNKKKKLILINFKYKKKINRNNKKVKVTKLKYQPMRYWLLSTKKVFIGKGDLKHTNDKVIITFYLYNTEGMYLSSIYKSIKKALFYPNRPLKKYITQNNFNQKIVTYNRIFNIYEYLSLSNQYEKYFKIITSIIKKRNEQLVKLYNLLKIISFLLKWNILKKSHYKTFLFKSNKYKVRNYIKFDDYLNIIRKKYQIKLFYYSKLLNINKEKNTSIYLRKFIPFIEQLYHKKIVFNIVNLKKMHLNSHIYTQIVSLKLRNRNNKLYRILKASLRKVRIDDFFKINYKKQKKIEDIFRNKIKNNLISSMFINVKEPLQDLLLKFFPNINNKSYNKYFEKQDLKRYIFKYLKHIKLRGIRVEAKGRLTRPRTAARSVFKMRYLGGLKKLDSSFMGLSCIMLRGNNKSNVQYSIINSKGRNGSFGVKSWVSSK